MSRVANNSPVRSRSEVIPSACVVASPQLPGSGTPELDSLLKLSRDARLQREERLQELGAALSAPHAGPSSCRETSELAVAAMTLKTALRPSSELSWPALISNLGELVRLNVELGLQRERQNQRLENAVIDGRCAQSRADTFKARLEDERAKNIVARLIRSSTCKRISELEQRARARSESLRATSERLHAEQSELVKLSANLQQELQTLTKEAAVRILREVVGHFSTIQKQLQESAVIKVLDDTLVKTNLLPALDQEAIPPAERSKIIDFVTRYLLADGPPVSFNEAPIYHRRLNEYNDLRSQLRPEVDLESITDTVSLRHYINSPLPRHFYRDQFALLCSAGARYEVNNVTNALHALGIAVPEPSEYQANDKYQSSRHGFQLDAVYLDTAKLLQGLERWKVIRETPGLPELFSPGVFEATTQILTERLHREDLVPGGRESTAGTVAAFKMVQLGSLRAIPYFVEHLKLHGAVHTSAVVAHQLLSMWSSLSDDQKTQCREVIGRNDFRALELLASPSSFLNRIARPDSYYQASVVHDPSTFLIKERLVGILERNPEFSEEQVGAFYREFKFNSSKVLQAFLAERKEVEKLIAGERLDFWTRGYPALLTALCDPRNGVLTLPRTIAIDGMGVSDSNALETLERVVTSDRFCKSGFDRKALVEGIVFLNTREDGGKILLDLMDRYQGAKDDIRRLRRICQMMMTIDELGAWQYPPPNTETIRDLEKQKSQIETSLKDQLPKEERKALRNRLDGLKIELAGARGLQYMESTLTKALLAAVTSRLNLNDQGLDQVFAERLDDLLPTGLLEIVPALMARYEERNHPAVAETLREITTHIIRGDFEEWRVSHRLSAVQMQDFTDKQVAAWNSPLPSRYYAAAPLADVDRKAAQLKAVRQILRNAREHIEESIAAEVAKFSEFQRIVDDIVRLEAISPEAFSEDAILQAGGKIAQALDLVGLQQARTDILQLSRVFEQSGFSKIEVYEVTDAIGLLKLGTEPQETCQSWRRGAYNECLLAYVADTNKRAIAIRDEAGQALLRGVIKSTRARDKGDFSGKTMKPIIFCEKPYFVSGDSLTMRAYFEFALEKARLVGAPVVLGFNLSSEVQRILIEEAAKVGLRVSEQRTMSIHIPPSMNEFEYSDALGGKISYFGGFRDFSGIVVEAKAVS